MISPGKPFYRRLSDTLILRNVASEADVEKYIQFNTQYNNPFEGAASACLLNFHPETAWDNFWIVEDERTCEIVSTTCLIPWKLHFNGMELYAAQLEMVLTHPDFRGKGLVRAQVDIFHQTLHQCDFDLSLIWGIPYFYRQFGYAYAIDGDVVETMSTDLIPDSYLSQPQLKLRPAAAADIPFLMMMYTQVVKDLDLYTTRSEKYWDYLLNAARHPIEILEDQQSNQPLGYLVLRRTSDRVSLLESALPDTISAQRVLGLLKFQQHPKLDVCFPRSTHLVQTMQNLGSQTYLGGQWLVRFPDLRRWFLKITPILNSRLGKTRLKNLPKYLVINLYRQAFALKFEEHEIKEVVDLGFVDYSMGADGGDLCIPPDAFMRLALGYRSLDELSDAWPDIMVKPQVRNLIEILFPTQSTYLYLPYHFLGDLTVKSE